jgi:hypothetical protein
MKLYHELTAAAQAAYAGLDRAAQQLDLRRSMADLPGGFASKLVAGKKYWYYQIKQPTGTPQQIYVGPDDEATRQLIEGHKDVLKQSEQSAMRKLVNSAIALGCAEIPLKHARVIERLLNHGFFNAGGILVGTHAFLAYQNLFGVQWGAGAFTLDLDFAHAGKNVSIALNSSMTMDARKAIESLEMGFVPIQSNTTFKKSDEPDFDLDFLTSCGKGGDKPVHIENLNLTLQPLKFMELSLEAPIRLTVLGKGLPLVVNVPQPALYALHKLIISQERPQAQRTKANKDLTQAAALLDYLLDREPDDLADAYRAVEARGPRWRKCLHAGWKAMEDAPENAKRALNFGTRLSAALASQA